MREEAHKDLQTRAKDINAYQWPLRFLIVDDLLSHLDGMTPDNPQTPIELDDLMEASANSMSGAVIEDSDEIEAELTSNP